MPRATNTPVAAGAVGAALARPAHAAGFGWTDDGANYVVDTGAQL